MNLNPNEIYEKLVTAGNEWSEANYAAELLEESKKSLLAQLMTKSAAPSRVAAETKALASFAYKEHIELMVSARRDANKARVKYDSARVYSELLRTQAANERAANREAT